MAGPREQPLPPDVIDREDAVEVLRAFVLDHGFERIEPLLRFHDIGIVRGLRQDVIELG